MIELDKESDKPDPILAQLQERVRKASSELISERKLIKRRRRYMRGEVGSDEAITGDERKLVRSNLIYSTIDNIVPLVYAKNPETSIKPSEAVDDAAYPAMGGFCDTIEIVVQRLLKDAGLKKKAKRTVKASLVTGQGWVKLSYQRDIERDQAIIDRIADAQDNMQRLRHELKELEDASGQEKEEEIRSIELLTTSLEAKVEVTLSEGLAIDTIRREEIIVDPSIQAVGDYNLARWICQRIYMNKEDAEAMYDMELNNATLYNSDNEETQGENKRDKTGDLIIVYELWDRTKQHVFTFVDGHDKWLREPFVPTRCGQKFFPFLPLAILEDDEGKDLSMIDMLIELQDEYNTTRKSFAEHRAANVPHWLGDSSLKVEDVKSFAGAGTGDITMIDTGGRPLNTMIEAAPRLPIDYANYDTSPIRQDMDMVSGVQDAMRGAVGKAKTATEANIMQAGASGRIGAMQDTVEDWLQDVFKLAVEICLQEMDTEQARKYAGIGAVWAQLPKDEVFNLVKVEIRAGSSGKPDKAQDRESWAQIMPLLQDMYVQISQIEIQGGNAEPLRKLMRETLKRFDERIDVDEFIPSMQQQIMQDPMVQDQQIMQDPAMQGV